LFIFILFLVFNDSLSTLSLTTTPDPNTALRKKCAKCAKCAMQCVLVVAGKMVETGGSTRTWRTFKEKPITMLVNFTKMVVKLGKDDPRRLIHSIKFVPLFFMTTQCGPFSLSFLSRTFMWVSKEPYFN